ncbi:MAG: hypothetical protein ACFFFB_04875 [Candidatus Heimdallarchaeota archaeon]
MPNENENGKVEDFISLWKKKMESDNKNPSIIGDTLNKLSKLEQENEELRKKISQNIDLISRSEKLIRITVEEKDKLKVENESLLEINTQLGNLEAENLELNSKVKSMVKLLLEKDEEIKIKEEELSRLKASGISSDSTVSRSLIEDLRSELTKKNSLISELESKISELTAENEVINQQLVEKIKSLPIDYVVPIEQPEVIKPKPHVSSSQPLEQLCQDLQADLNKYKRVIDKLTKEKSQLKEMLDQKGLKFSPEDIINLREENEALKKDLTELQNSLKKTVSKEVSSASEEKISALELKLKEKEEQIIQLKLSQTAQEGPNSGPMTNLVEELQKSINKLKTTIQEKDQKIKELQESIGL